MVTNCVDVPNFKAVAAPIRVQALPTSDLNSITTVYVALLCSYKPKKFGSGSFRLRPLFNTNLPGSTNQLWGS